MGLLWDRCGFRRHRGPKQIPRKAQGLSCSFPRQASWLHATTALRVLWPCLAAVLSLM